MNPECTEALVVKRSGFMWRHKEWTLVHQSKYSDAWHYVYVDKRCEEEEFVRSAARRELNRRQQQKIWKQGDVRDALVLPKAQVVEAK